MNVLLVDASPIIYKQYSSVGHLATSSGEPTGLRFGFMRAIRSYQKRLKCTKVVIAFDLKGPIKKAENVPEYKSNRIFTPEKAKMYDQIPALREMISLTSWTQVEAEGFEADDIIGTVARKLSAQNHTIWIVTTDNDMAQLIDKDVKIFVPGKYEEIKDKGWVVKDFGVTPGQLLFWRAATGDVSDNLKVPALTAFSLGMFKRFLENLQTENPTFEQASGFNFGSDEREKWTRNVHVMTLHEPEKLTVKKGSADEKSLRELFSRLEMKSLLPKVGEFVEQG